MYRKPHNKFLTNLFSCVIPRVCSSCIKCSPRGTSFWISVEKCSFSSWMQSNAVRCVTTDRGQSSWRSTDRANRETTFWPGFMTYWAKLRSVSHSGTSLQKLPKYEILSLGWHSSFSGIHKKSYLILSQEFICYKIILTEEFTSWTPKYYERKVPQTL